MPPRDEKWEWIRTSLTTRRKTHGFPCLPNPKLKRRRIERLDIYTCVTSKNCVDKCPFSKQTVRAVSFEAGNGLFPEILSVYVQTRLHQKKCVNGLLSTPPDSVDKPTSTMFQPLVRRTVSLKQRANFKSGFQDFEDFTKFERIDFANMIGQQIKIKRHFHKIFMSGYPL